LGDESTGTHSRFASQSGKEFAIVTNLVVPKTGGMNTTKVTIVRWIKSEGDAFKQGEPIVELETEKVSYELDAPVDGVLLKILVREPSEVEVGGVLGYIGKAGDAAPAS
jgi:pyruvate/2-oxoglutarate dehydrogenase complex dihydrolipoamide acyltransferase (E2) component